VTARGARQVLAALVVVDAVLGGVLAAVVSDRRGDAERPARAVTATSVAPAFSTPVSVVDAPEGGTPTAPTSGPSAPIASTTPATSAPAATRPATTAPPSTAAAPTTEVTTPPTTIVPPSTAPAGCVSAGC